MVKVSVLSDFSAIEYQVGDKYLTGDELNLYLKLMRNGENIQYKNNKSMFTRGNKFGYAYFEDDNYKEMFPIPLPIMMSLGYEV